MVLSTFGAGGPEQWNNGLTNFWGRGDRNNGTMVLSTFGAGGPRDLGTMEQWFDQLLGPGVLFTRGPEAPRSSLSRLREKLGLRLENFHPGIEDRHHQTLNQLHPRLEDD